MTSVARSSTLGRSLPASAGFIPAYFTNSAGYSQPFPWRYNRSTQAIDLDFVDGFTVSTDLSDDEMFFRGQNFGGLSLVQRLGPNFVAWCEANSSISADVGTVELYEAPIVVRANMVAPGMNPNNAESQESTDPISFESAAGSVEGQYCKTLVFMKPMVIRYTRSETQYYRWFNQNFEGNS
jgi:hypothetical protein